MALERAAPRGQTSHRSRTTHGLRTMGACPSLSPLGHGVGADVLLSPTLPALTDSTTALVYRGEPRRTREGVEHDERAGSVA